MKYLIVQSVVFGNKVIINLNNVRAIYSVTDSPEQSIFYFNTEDTSVQVDHPISYIAEALVSKSDIIDLDSFVATKKHIESLQNG